MRQGLMGGLLLCLVAGCGGSKPTETTPEKTESEPVQSSWEPPPLPMEEGPLKMLGLKGPEKPWDKMSYEEREWYMIGNVHPIMRQVFQTFDAQKYEGEKFECTPCHSKNAKEEKYKMPNRELSAVPAPGSAEYEEMRGAKIVKFMEQRVTPVMAQILGEQPYDPATKQGFSCNSCHPQQ